MRRMVAAYRSLLKTHQQLLNKSKALSEDEGSLLKPVIRAMEEQMDIMAGKIAEEAGKRYPAYNKLVEGLGIRGNAGAMEALAEIITYIDANRGFVKTARLFGLFKPSRGKKKFYDGRLRRALQRLTASVNRISPPRLRAKFESQTLYRIWTTHRQEAQRRLAMPAQQG